MVPKRASGRAGLPRLAVALELLAHVAQRVLRALAVELVDRDEVREVEHVDLLELARRAELGVITYSDVSTSGTIAASPCPMPDVSTIDKSKPATLHAAITSGAPC
jgi:hypothetical protein